MRRRDLLRVGGAVTATAFVKGGTALAQAQAWPDRPVKLILPYAPGGATDLMGRPWAEKLSQAFGQQFVIENRGGAGGMIGTEAAAKATPDGYTLFFAPGATLTVLPLMRKTPYDPIKSFTPIARVGDLVCGFVINPAVGPKTFNEMVSYAKQNPGKLAYGSAGLGTASQLRVEMLKYRAKIDILHVPYRGSADALNDLLPNTVQMMNEINVLPHVKAGKLTLLNINYPLRHPDFPDVPTLTELGYPNSDVGIWYSLQAPAGTPKEIVAKLSAKVQEIAATDDMKARMRAINVVVPLQSPEQMAQHLVDDIKATGELIRDANIKLE
jgi:tripartite-type tricarboxylate transporter receptor subunit TctC